MIHEDISIVNLSKSQMLTTKFENIKMKNDEIFFEFYTKINNINSCFNLAEKIFYSKNGQKNIEIPPSEI